ncbi:hypothetical protein Tco_0122842, partial [Tanacetum coccineum]
CYEIEQTLEERCLDVLFGIDHLIIIVLDIEIEKEPTSAISKVKTLSDVEGGFEVRAHEAFTNTD